MISIDDLTVTQNGFRNEDQIKSMIDFVAQGGAFNTAALSTYSSGKDLRLIKVVRFEDGRLFIHDGHHRVAAIYLGGRNHLYDGEFAIEDWTYASYTEINFEVGWVTPFDPRSEVRTSDYDAFKHRVRKKLLESDNAAIYYINESHALRHYCSDRTVLTIKDLLRYI